METSPGVVITGKGLVDGETGLLFQTATLVGLSGGKFLFQDVEQNSFCFGVPLGLADLLHAGSREQLAG